MFFIPYIMYGQKLYMDVVGKDTTATRVLSTLDFIRAHENIKSVYEEANALQNKLHKRGYFQNTIDSVIKKDSLCSVYFSLGDKTDFIKAKTGVSHLNILKALGIEIVNDSIKIKPEDFETTLYSISKAFEAKGDPFSEIKLTDIKTKGRFLLGRLSITQTKTRRIDTVFIRGYKKLSPVIIKRISKIKEGDLFNIEDIRKKAEKLDQLPYVNQIKPPEVLFSKDATQLYIYVEKVNANYFDGFLGFATDEETQKLQLNGYLNVRLLNNLNAGEELHLNWKNNGNDQSIFNATAKIPYLFKSALGANAAIHIIKQDSTFTNTSTSLSLDYNFNANSKLGFGIENTESANLRTVVIPEINVMDYNAFFLKSEYKYSLIDKDHPAFNEKIRLHIALAAGNRKISSIRTNQQKLHSTLSYQWKLNYKNRIYVRNITEYLFSEDYLYNEKYRFGGINSLRGFNENSLEATFYTIINTEYRLLLSKNLYIHSIFDAARIEDNDLNTKNTLYGFGFGLGAITSGGILKINYALGKSPKTPVRFSDAKVHISFSTFF